MKKAISLLLAAVTAAAVLPSCAEGDDLLTHKYNYDLSEYIELADYKELPAQGYRFNVTDEQIEQQVLATRAFYSRSNVVTDRGAELGDLVYVDYVTTVDGVAIEGGTESDVELTIGIGSFITEFEDALIGAYAGDHLSVDGTFPEPYPEYPEMSGKDAHFEIDVNEVREQELPEYTDDFVRAYLGYESTEDYEANLVVLLEEHYKEIYYDSVISQIWPTILENTTVKQYPETEVREMYDDMVSSSQAYAKAQGVNFGDYLEAVFNMSEDDFYEYAQNEAEARIKEEMVCYAIARAENITLSEEEYTERATEYAVDLYGLASLEAFEAIYDKGVIRQTLMLDLVKELVADSAVMTYLN